MDHDPADLRLAVTWGKLGEGEAGGTYHPLVCHMLDVAAVTRAIWDAVVPPGARRRLSEGLGLETDSAARWVTLWSALHDLGKMAPAFAFQRDALRTAIEAAGLPSMGVVGRGQPRHGTITAATLPSILETEFGHDSDLAWRIGVVVGGHHGVFPRRGDAQGVGPSARGGRSWAETRSHLAQTLGTVLGVPKGDVPHGLDTPSAMALAGLVSVADWIGSNTDFFPHIATISAPPSSLDVAAYYETARANALRALDELGWTGWTSDAAPRPFHALFPSIPMPNSLQTAIEELRFSLDAPGLVVVEAPMGEGKTEVALALADSWGNGLGQRGAYLALPTMATSNQMFSRLKDFLRARYPDQQVNLQLLHGHAALSSEFEALRQAERRRRGLFMPRGIYDEESDRSTAGVLAAEWFTYRKRGLLAPFGVGTIDQALLAVLRTRHGFVRIFGLAYKTVVVDEVHAYDAYMLTLLDRLLEWLGGLGASVVLLSATLPTLRRVELIAAYQRGRGEPSQPELERPARYPRITWTAGPEVRSQSVTTSPRSTKRVQLTWMPPEIPPHSTAFPMGEHLSGALSGGGCAAVICNTVGRAQQMYRALRPFFPGQAEDGSPAIELLHAQFPFQERQRREERCMQRFGKPSVGKRPSRAVLIATQVIEQSLDLDFDLMVSDLAPIDLLLQRVGRLHRHVRARPPSRADAHLWVLGGVDASDQPVYPGGASVVYDEHVLLRTWMELRHTSLRDGGIRIPEEIEGLIDAVYDDQRTCPSAAGTAIQDRWEATQSALQQKRRDYQLEAERREILPPFEGDGVFEQYNLELDEDDPAVHQSLQALTRLGEPSVGVVLVGPDEPAFDGSSAPSMQNTRQLLGRSLSVSRRDLVFQLIGETVPAGWRRSALLRNQRLVRLDRNGEASVGRIRLHLDPDVGLEVLDSH